MLKHVEDGVTSKISLGLIFSSIGTKTSDALGWITENAAQMLTIATLVLTIVMIFGHILEQFRKNRAERMDNVKKELEIEKLRRELDNIKHDEDH